MTANARDEPERGHMARASERPTRYAWLVLAMLMMGNLLSFMDRFLMNVVSQPMKEELHLTDWQLGLLNGTAFALSSTLVGLPLARLAERFNRASIIAGCIIVWSGMTSLCGFASNLWQMLAFRTGVGVGEAGSTPASHSLIADYFPPRRRATALSLYTIGMPLGALAGSILGGWITDQWGWRSAFLLLGGPGILAALFLRAIVREPARGRFDPPVSSPAPPPIGKALRLLATTPTARHIILGQVGAIMVAIAASTFYAPFLVRKFAISYTEMGLLLSATYLAGGTLGNLGGGLLADWGGRRDRRWYLWVPAIGIALAFPLYFACYLQPTLMGTCMLLFVASIPSLAYTAPGYSVLHNIVEARMRATMVALVQIIASLIGGGLGPLLGGATIDLLAERFFPLATAGEFAQACPGGIAPAHAAATLVLACHDALLQATQWALIGWAPLFLWPAFHFWRAARTIRVDWPALPPIPTM